MNDSTIWCSLNEEWKQLIIKNILVQQNLDSLEDFCFWNGTSRNAESIRSGQLFFSEQEPLEFPVKLDIFSTQINSLMPLAETTGLQEFYMGETNVTDLEPISNNSQMSKLCCYHAPISQIDPLSKLINIKRLCLSKTKITDISPLASLLELEKLALYHTMISDLSPLSKLPKLKKLNINYTKVRDLSPLYGLRALEELHCFQSLANDQEISRFKLNSPSCKVIANYEQPETEYDDFA